MNVVAFGAHPDDIEIGMGGTVARHASMGDRDHPEQGEIVTAPRV